MSNLKFRKDEERSKIISIFEIRKFEIFSFFLSLTTSKIIIFILSKFLHSLSKFFELFTKFSRNVYKFFVTFTLISYSSISNTSKNIFFSDKKLRINLDWTHLNILTNSSLRHLTNNVPCSHTWDTSKPEEHCHYHRSLSQTRPYIRLYFHNPRTSLKIRFFANWKRFHHHRPSRWWNQLIFQTHTRLTSTTT